jgi:hypothetical protein
MWPHVAWQTENRGELLFARDELANEQTILCDVHESADSKTK